MLIPFINKLFFNLFSDIIVSNEENKIKHLDDNVNAMTDAILPKEFIVNLAGRLTSFSYFHKDIMLM